jgi:hypothetical protein
MLEVWSAFWRAWLDACRGRVLLMCLLPFLLVTAVLSVLFFFFWEDALVQARDVLVQWQWLDGVLAWFDRWGMEKARSVLSIIVVVFLATPLVTLVCMVLVLGLMGPYLLSWVARSRFAGLQKLHGGGFWWGMFRAMGLGLLAMLLSVLSTPLWLIPPLGLVVPAIIWAWVNTSILWFDALADHASVEERKALLRRMGIWPWLMGLAVGVMGAWPGLIWSVSLAHLPLIPLLAPLAMWVFVWVFVLSYLWFVHYALKALETLRIQRITALPEAA